MVSEWTSTWRINLPTIQKHFVRFIKNVQQHILCIDSSDIFSCRVSHIVRRALACPRVPCDGARMRAYRQAAPCPQEIFHTSLLVESSSPTGEPRLLGIAKGDSNAVGDFYLEDFSSPTFLKLLSFFNRPGLGAEQSTLVYSQELGVG